jgi:hypothetical protein
METQLYVPRPLQVASAQATKRDLRLPKLAALDPTASELHSRCRLHVTTLPQTCPYEFRHTHTSSHFVLSQDPPSRLV